MSEKVLDVIERAIYGSTEIKPEERSIFLSTILERIHIALTKKQVIHKGMYPEVLEVLKKQSNLHLYLNGDLNYSNYSNYIQEATKLGIRFTIVTPQKQTPFGLVLADEARAIDRANIFVKDDLYEREMQEQM
jgi:uncharacterized protein YueI